MASIVSKEMLNDSLDGLFNKNVETAIAVQEMDDKVDSINHDMHNLIQTKILNDSKDLYLNEIIISVQVSRENCRSLY